MVYVFYICYSYFSYCHTCVGPSSHYRWCSLILTVWGMPSIASETEGSCCCHALLLLLLQVQVVDMEVNTVVETVLYILCTLVIQMQELPDR